MEVPKVSQHDKQKLGRDYIGHVILEDHKKQLINNTHKYINIYKVNVRTTTEAIKLLKRSSEKHKSLKCFTALTLQDTTS